MVERRDELEGVSIRSVTADAKKLGKETVMADRKDPPKSPLARETRGEGAPKRKRNEATVTAEELAEPQRGNERVDGHMIERKRDAHNPEGI
jgi:hypothetical protein